VSNEVQLGLAENGTQEAPDASRLSMGENRPTKSGVRAPVESLDPRRDATLDDRLEVIRERSPPVLSMECTRFADDLFGVARDSSLAEGASRAHPIRPRIGELVHDGSAVDMTIEALAIGGHLDGGRLSQLLPVLQDHVARGAREARQ
jgi:hypothetical protein